MKERPVRFPENVLYDTTKAKKNPEYIAFTISLKIKHRAIGGLFSSL